MKNQIRVIALLATVIASPSYAAVWSLGSSETYPTYSAGDCITTGAGGNTSSGSTTFGNERHCTVDPTSGAPTVANATLVVTAWSNTANDTNTNLESAYVGVFSGGLGVTNRDGDTQTTNCTGGTTTDRCEGTPTNTNPPEHTVDNNERFDSLLFTFDNKVALDKITTGYVSGDSDFSLWVYDASGTPGLSGTTYSSLGAGWKLVGNYDGGTSSGTITVNTGATVYSSSYWLIGAYNTAVSGGTCYKANGDTGGTCNMTVLDQFKVASVSDKVPTTQVPEPATLGLMGLGLLGMSRLRRKRQ